MAPDAEPLRHTSLASSAADWITARILEGEIKPGQRVTEVGLAERMGISRSPVREALRELAREGLITVEPRRGARVGELDLRSAEELYACRLLLEPACAAAAVAAMDDALLAELEGAFGRMRAAVAAHDAVDYVAALKDYDRTLLDGCPNRTLFGYAESAWRSALRYWDLLVRGTPDYLDRSLERNADLHRAVRTRDPEAVREAMSAAVSSGLRQLVEVLGRLESAD